MRQTKYSVTNIPPLPEGFDVTPADVLGAIKRLLASWSGDKPDDANYFRVVNQNGTRKPVFWVMQSAAEFAQLSAALPDDQPLYGMKSVYMGGAGFSQEESLHFFAPPFVDAVSDAFLADIWSVTNGGAFILGGNCTGSVSALDMALRAARLPDTLLLMNLPTPPKPYSGRTELLFGGEELKEFQSGPDYSNCFENQRLTTLTGAHGGYFRSDQINVIADRILDAT